jgi:hypothetical protein
VDRHTPWKKIIDSITEFRPSFAHDILGAEEHEVAHLGKTVGQHLLPEYREFLRWMGHGLGGLKVDTSDFDIDTICKIYRQPIYHSQSSFLLIGEQQDDEIAYDVCLSNKEGQVGRVVRVVFSCEQQKDGTLRLVWDRPKPYGEALSLQASIFRAAFIQFRLRKFGTSYMFVRDRDAKSGRDTALVEEVFNALGFRKHRLFDAWNRYYESDDAVLAYLRISGEGAQFLLATDNPSSLKRFNATVKDRLDMREA